MIGSAWDHWKAGFDAWESITAKYLEQWVRSPALLEPAGGLLAAFAKARAAGDEAVAAFWAALGLPTRRDQERALHLLDTIGGKLIDLEDRIAELEARLDRKSPAHRRT